MAAVALLGSTDITVAVADAVIATGHRVSAIVHVGRQFPISYSVRPISVSRLADIPSWCAKHGAEAVLYRDIDMLHNYFSSNMADLCIAAGWYHFVPARIRDLFRCGTVGLHASMLPQLRGGAPLNWAILAGFRETGLSLFQLGDGIDDGPIYAQISIPIYSEDYIDDLVNRLRPTSANLVQKNLDGILTGKILAHAQTGIPTYGLQRRPEDGRIDWCRSCEDILRLVRAVSRPYSGAFAIFEGMEVHIWRARARRDHPIVYGAPGQIFRIHDSDGVGIVTGRGVIEINEATDSSSRDLMPVLLRSVHGRLE